MNNADDIRRALERARLAMEQLDRTIAEAERAVGGPVKQREPLMQCPAAKCTLAGYSALPVCGSWFCPGRPAPNAPWGQSAQLAAIDRQYEDNTPTRLRVCPACGGQGFEHADWCPTVENRGGRGAEGDCP